MVFSRFKSRYPSGDSVSIGIDLLPIQVRPLTIQRPGRSMCLLSGDSWAPTLCHLIKNSRQSIRMAAYSVSARWPITCNDKFNVYKALRDAAEREIDCRCVLATHKKTAATSRFNYTSSIELKNSGWQVRRAPRGRLLHMKLLIIDNQFVIVGSHNIAHAASASNLDLSVCIDDMISAVPFMCLFNDIYSASE